MAKPQQTIASLVREAAKTEETFFSVLNDVLDNEEPERVEQFFARLNIPRSAKADDTLYEDGTLPSQSELTVTTFEQEMHITEGVQKFLDRHMRKLKWHVAHPGLDSAQNCVRLYRAMGTVTELRVRRVMNLLRSKDSLTVEEWGNARELLNRSYREIREATGLVTGAWIDALMASVDPDEVKEALVDFPPMVSELADILHKLRDEIEERRQEMEVLPEGYPPVRPPRYFGGDLLDTSSWRHFWGELSGMCDNLRNALEV